MESAIFSVMIDIGLSAACGFRIFLPLLIMSAASRADYLTLSGSFEWISSTPALITFATATVLAIGAYYIPFLDNALDAAAAPAAVTAGGVTTASQVGDMDPLLGWSLAIVGGGGAAGTVQGLTTVARQFTSLATGGFGNPLLSTIEAGASLVMTVLAIVVPLAAVFVFLVLLFYTAKRLLLKRAPAEAG